MPNVGGSLDRLTIQTSWRLLRQPLFLVPVKTYTPIFLTIVFVVNSVELLT